MPRSEQFEHDFLDEACRGAGLVSVGLTEMAEARLADGALLYEDRSLALPLEELTGQIEEEVVDIACWSALLAQADGMEELDDDTRMGVLGLLESLTATAARQAFLVREVRNTLKRLSLHDPDPSV